MAGVENEYTIEDQEFLWQQQERVRPPTLYEKAVKRLQVEYGNVAMPWVADRQWDATEEKFLNPMPLGDVEARE